MPARKPAGSKDGTPSAAKPHGDTHANIAQEPAPRLPHEHDQSADHQGGPPDPNVVQAAKDVKRGLVDTDRGVQMDEAYKKQQRGG